MKDNDQAKGTVTSPFSFFIIFYTFLNGKIRSFRLLRVKESLESELASMMKAADEVGKSFFYFYTLLNENKCEELHGETERTDVYS